MYRSLLARQASAFTRVSSFNTSSAVLSLTRRNMSAAASSSSSKLRVPGPIVSVDWLKQHAPHLSSTSSVKVVDASLTPVVKIVDASWYMPAEKQDPAANYQKSRIPTAVFFDLEACTSKEGANAKLPHMMPSASQFAEYASSLGLKRDDTIIVYDGKGIFSAPRIRLTFQHFGADNIAVLDGGLKAWIAAGGSTESGAPTTKPTPAKFEAKVRDGEFILDMASVEENSDLNNASFTLLDARSAGRFNGTEPEPRPDLPSGHIFGAVNIPFMSLLDTDATAGGATKIKSKEELTKIFEKAGVDVKNEEQQLVASCGSGVTACIILLAMEILGRGKNTKTIGLYDGSWTEWAMKKPNKIVTAAKK